MCHDSMTLSLPVMPQLADESSHDSCYSQFQVISLSHSLTVTAMAGNTDNDASGADSGDDDDPLAVPPAYTCPVCYMFCYIISSAAQPRQF